ncbi:MAG TPA: SRPBCC domain-containing protein, partial [Rhodothermales bacterium]|nr:SRPBCC domain-containing protein [Rhodothermales bacterium]
SGEDSEVRFELTPVEDKVRLVVIHSRLGVRNVMVGVSGGWHAHLDVLAARLYDRTPPGFWRSFNRLEAEYEERI